MAELVKIQAQKASEILTHFELSEEAAEFADQGNLTPADFVRQLLQANLYYDAVKFLAHALLLGFTVDQLSGGDVFQSDSHGLEQGQGLVRGAARHSAGYNVP